MDTKHGLFVSLAGAIVGIGVVMVYSASITSWPTEFEQVYLSRQIGALAVGCILALFCARVPVDNWKRWSPWLLAATIMLLAAVLVPGIGTRVNGARRWLRLAGLQFQPSELAKITLALFLCSRAVEPRPSASPWREAVRTVGIPVFVTAGLVVVEPDLGTALFLFAFSAIALIAAGWRMRKFVTAGLLALPAIGLVVTLRPYQAQRITGFLAAWSDHSRIPYQLEQSLIALGSGGLLGVGLGKGLQKLSFLPEANTDFVFAVVGEELGLIGTLGLLVLWGAFYCAGLKLIGNARNDRFASTAAFTLLTQMTVQAAANMAVVTALLPPKGVPLPLVSYGGSALVMSLASVGIIVSLTRGPVLDATCAQCPRADLP